VWPERLLSNRRRSFRRRSTSTDGCEDIADTFVQSIPRRRMSIPASNAEVIMANVEERKADS
jgi:hypothetical protein